MSLVRNDGTDSIRFAQGIRMENCKMMKANVLKLVFSFFLLTVVFCAGCQEPSWRFIVTGDSRGGDNGVNTEILGELACEIVKKKVDFVLFSGDLVKGYTDQTTLESQLNTWRNTMQPVYGADIKVYAVRGNHDVGKPAGVTAWNSIFGDMPDNGPAGEENLTYSLVHKNAFIVGVDEYVNPHRVNQEWVDGQFTANTRLHIFVFGHEPAFKARHVDCLDDYPADRDRFWASIEKAGGRVYFCGHDHFYNHACVHGAGKRGNGTHQYIVGTAGAPLYDWSSSYGGNNSNYTVESINHAKQYGYVLVEIDGFDVTISWVERVVAGRYKVTEVWSYTAAARSQR